MKNKINKVNITQIGETMRSKNNITKRKTIFEELTPKYNNEQYKATPNSRYNLLKTSAVTCSFLAIALLVVNDATAADGVAVELDMVKNAGATIKELIKGPGSLIIDGITIIGGGFASAKASSPVPLIFAAVSVICFELFVKLMMGS